MKSNLFYFLSYRPKTISFIFFSPFFSHSYIPMNLLCPPQKKPLFDRPPFYSFIFVFASYYWINIELYSYFMYEASNYSSVHKFVKKKFFPFMTEIYL